MPNTLSFRKIGNNLVPLSVEAIAFMGKTQQEQVVFGTFIRPRNGDHHRKFFALLKLVLDNQTRYRNMDEILFMFKKSIGYGDWIEDRAGNDFFVPRSISFAKMDQDAFDTFYRAAVDFVCAEIIPGLEEGDLLRELREITK